VFVLVLPLMVVVWIWGSKKFTGVEDGEITSYGALAMRTIKIHFRAI
jgi:hypothetical protein